MLHRGTSSTLPGRGRTVRCRGVVVRARRRVRALPDLRQRAWHYELRPEAIAHGCPPIYADPRRTHGCCSDRQAPASIARSALAATLLADPSARSGRWGGPLSV